MVQMICWMNWENKEIYSERLIEYLYTHEQYTYEYTNLLTNDNLGIYLGQVFFLRLKNTLLNRIDNGELLPGERLESERDLAEKYGVNRQTVR